MTREERLQQKHDRALRTCKHFNGIQGPGSVVRPCRAGVSYRELVGGPDFGWVTKLPCLPPYPGKEGVERVHCPLIEFPTLVEVETKEREFEELVRLVDVAVKLCLEDAGDRRGIIGVIECPKCQGQLNYSISRYNGHLNGRCKTPDCLSWMQ